MNKLIVLVFSVFILSCNDQQELVLNTSGLQLEFSVDGTIKKVIFQDGKVVKNINGRSALQGCKTIDVQFRRISEASLAFKKRILDTVSNRELELTETFTTTDNSIRWEIALIDNGEFWSTPIQTILQYPSSKKVKIWAPWADPRGDLSGGGTDNKLIANAIIGEGDVGNFTSWADPLEPMEPANNLWHYGAPRYEYEKPGILYCPFQGDVIAIPMISFLEADSDTGLSLILSPEDTLLDINMETTKEGEVKFSRFNHRIGKGNTIKFSMDLVPHQADWRSSLGWVVNRYKNYFYPPNHLAKEIAGTGAYSNSDVPFDVDKMKKMAFRVNWRASFDFPYMGMFIPPVEENEAWTSFVRYSNIGKIPRKPTSVQSMDSYAKQMSDHGFYVLSYFNVTEFGTQMEYPRPASKRKEGEPVWKDANDYLYENLADAILFAADRQRPVLDKGIYSVRGGEPFFTWEKALALDPGVESFQNFLIDQAKKTSYQLPNSFGICIDRMDWTRFYNHKTDDGVSWMGGQPVGSLYMSWMDIMSKLNPIFHDNNKVIYVNNHVKRIEQLRYVDGIFDEFTYAGASLNAIALLGNQKPVLGWISDESQLQPDPDEIIQKFLYMGVFPMAPFPGNDHSMGPSELADKVYLDYGPLLDQLRGKEWVLESHVISTTSEAKINLFKTFDDYTVPIVFAKDSDEVEITIRKKELTKEGLSVKAYHPGIEKPILIASKVINGELKMKVPIHRNCAVLKIEL